MAERWFTGKFLSLAIGLNNVVGQLGAASAAWLGPTIFVGKRDIQWVCFIMSCACFFCWVVAVAYCIIEDKLVKEELEQDDAIEEQLFNRRKQSINDMKASGVTEEEIQARHQGENNLQGVEAKFGFGHVKYLGGLFWLLTFVFAFTSMSFFQFTNFVTDFLMQRFKYDYLDAKNLVTMIPITAIVMIPLLSGIVVVIGKKGFALMIAAGIASGVFWWLETMTAEPSFRVTICILLIGFFYALYSSVIWSSMTLVVPQQGTNVALGLATTI